MSHTFPIRRRLAAARALLFSSAAALAAWTSGCSDNVGCVFIGGCDGGGPISENAFLPVDGDVILDGPPAVRSFSPEGTDNPETVPIVLVFNETVQEESLNGAFELVPLFGAGITGPPVSNVAQHLVSDGRVLLLLPAGGLDPGEYALRLSETSALLDLTGQELDEDPSATLGSFGVSDTPPVAPQVVATFPENGATSQSETTEIVVVFDRPVLPSSVNDASFDVRVDGVDPANDPPPAILVPNDARAFSYRSVDLDGVPVPLGTGVEVEVSISPANAPILEQPPEDDVVAPRTITFDTLTVGAPLSASILSDPNDAIGRANLTPGDLEELAIEVELPGLEPNDNVDVFVFGPRSGEEEDPPLIALQRFKRLDGVAPILSVIFELEELALLRGDDPDTAFIADGPITFAFRVRRLALTTPMRVLDLDPDPDVIQDPVLDTKVPTIDGLIGSTDTEEFRSDLRGLSLAGIVADEDPEDDIEESVRSVEVATPLGNNPPLAPVVAAGDGAGRAFLAAPVPLGIVPGGTTTYSFVARDPALNAAPAETGSFTQVGVVGGAALAPGGTIDVHVFDSRTLQPLAGAQVLVHADHGNGNFPFVEVGVTGADGRTSVTTQGAPSVAAIVTVVLDDYDLFTLHGVPGASLSVPLSESEVATARLGGAALTNDPGAAAFLGDLDVRFDDSRRPVQLPRGFPTSGCAGTPLTCPHVQIPIQDEELGASSFFAGVFLQNEVAYSPTQLLQAFTMSLPLAPVASNGTQTVTLVVPSLLTSGSTPPGDAVQAIPPFTFRVALGSGVDLGNLSDDPTTTGFPRAAVDVLVPGLTRSLAVAQALCYDRGGGEWTVRSALPGAITAAGSLGSIGAVETDPFVRVEALDTAANSCGVRPRGSAILAAAPNATFTALALARQLSPAASTSSGGQAFTVVLSHAIADDRTEKGLYRVELSDLPGRRWTLWRFDPAGTADVQIRVVDVADAAAVGLADGTLTSAVSAFAWSTLDPLAFLWTDVEREFELFSHAAPLTFTKP